MSPTKDPYPHLTNDGLKFLQWIAQRSLSEPDLRRELLYGDAKEALKREHRKRNRVGKLDLKALERVEVRFFANTPTEVNIVLPALPVPDTLLDIESIDVSTIAYHWPQ